MFCRLGHGTECGVEPALQEANYDSGALRVILNGLLI